MSDSFNRKKHEQVSTENITTLILLKLKTIVIKRRGIGLYDAEKKGKAITGEDFIHPPEGKKHDSNLLDKIQSFMFRFYWYLMINQQIAYITGKMWMQLELHNTGQTPHWININKYWCHVEQISLWVKTNFILSIAKIVTWFHVYRISMGALQECRPATVHRIKPFTSSSLV